jgi:repressor of nif and glnA expression
MVIGQSRRQVEREQISILNILSGSIGAQGSKIIARRLRDEFGIELSERGVRYHLKILDDIGWTRMISRRDGRIITALGLEELGNAMVSDKVGFVIEKIESLAFQTTFNYIEKKGKIPINVSFFPHQSFSAAVRAMKPVFKAKYAVSDLISIGVAGEKLGSVLVPNGYVGLATVCSIVVNSTLLKGGVPMDSRFGGILQVKSGMPLRFTELIDYTGSSLDPSEIFMSSHMTSVNRVILTGNGKVLANFREIPAICLSRAKELLENLKGVGISAVLTIGEPGKSICEIPVGVNKIGLVLIGGLNPVAVAMENGIRVINKAMSSLIDFGELTQYDQIL